MSQAWQQQPERGSRSSVRLMVWVAQSLGRPVARVLLFPICFYFLLGSGTARRAIGRFRERVMGRPAGWRELFRHYHAFAATILDRIYFLRARFDLFDIRFHGLDVLDRELAKGRGCVLLGSHLGSFEVVRAMGLLRRQLEIRILMDEQNAPLIRRLIQGLNPTVAETVIQVGGADTMLQVKECLDRGGVVGIMGDRVLQNEQTVTCAFLGGEARFPTGAMRLAHVVRAPVVLFFGLYGGDNRYEVYLELFSEEVRLSQDRRSADLKQWTQRYADRLEAACRLAPDNWFNFYDFWYESH
ncbi:MAG: LpxL/LpxP family acyltransferase [Nitrospiraceae bacterium]